MRDVSYSDIVKLYKPRDFPGAIVLVKAVAKGQLGFLPETVARQWLYLAGLWFWKFVEPSLLPTAQRDIAVLARILPRFKIFLSEQDFDLDRTYSLLG